MRFKIVRLTTICNKLRTISASKGLELLQMVSKLDTGWCASEDAGPQGMDCEIPHWLERGMSISYKSVETSP